MIRARAVRMRSLFFPLCSSLSLFLSLRADAERRLPAAKEPVRLPGGLVSAVVKVVHLTAMHEVLIRRVGRPAADVGNGVPRSPAARPGRLGRSPRGSVSKVSRKCLGSVSDVSRTPSSLPLPSRSESASSSPAHRPWY